MNNQRITEKYIGRVICLAEIDNCLTLQLNHTNSIMRKGINQCKKEPEVLEFEFQQSISAAPQFKFNLRRNFAEEYWD